MNSTGTAFSALPQIEHINISLSQVLGFDHEIFEFMEQHWTIPDFGFSTRHHNQTMLRLAYIMNPMVVIERKDGYYVIGEGRAYWLAQQLYQPDDLVLALLIKSGRLRKQQKLQILAADLIIYHALARTRPHLPHQLYYLCAAIAESGFIAIDGIDPETTSACTLGKL